MRQAWPRSEKKAHAWHGALPLHSCSCGMAPLSASCSFVLPLFICLHALTARFHSGIPLAHGSNSWHGWQLRARQRQQRRRMPFQQHYRAARAALKSAALLSRVYECIVTVLATRSLKQRIQHGSRRWCTLAGCWPATLSHHIFIGGIIAGASIGRRSIIAGIRT